MEKNKMCYILRQYVKDMEKQHLEFKLSNNDNDYSYYLKNSATALKDAQKCLEYIRKDYPFEYKIEDNTLPFINIEQIDHNVKVWGRDTWKKLNRWFEVSINDEVYKNIEKKYLRITKLKRIIYD